MARIKLITHTDLDGVSCAIAAYATYGTANVDVTYCNYDDVDAAIEQLIADEMDNEFETYSVVYITDLSLTENASNLIYPYTTTGYIKVFDHHETSNVIPAEHVHLKCVDDVGKPTSGTSLFSEYLRREVISIREDRLRDSLFTYAELVRIYDTYEFRNNEEYKDYSHIVLTLHSMLDIYGRDAFVDKMVDRLIKNQGLILKEDEMICEIMNKQEQDYIKKHTDKAIVCENGVYVFADMYTSNIGYTLYTKYPDKVIYIINIIAGTVSLRASKSSGIDVSEIAKSHGGGGHPLAAGFPLPESGKVLEKLLLAALYTDSLDDLTKPTPV